MKMHIARMTPWAARVAVAAATLLLASTASAVVTTAADMGAAGVGQAPGFNCDPSMSYKMDAGVAKCAIAISATPVGAACAPQANFASGACRYDVPGAPNGGTSNAPNKTAGYTGSVSMTCTNGSWGGTSVTCVPDAPVPVPCAATTLFSGSCSYPVPATADGGSLVAANAMPGYTGSTTAQCTTGVWSTSGATCVPVGPPPPPPPPTPCAAQVVFSGACGYALPAKLDGASITVGTATAGYTGSISALCTSGTWSTSGATCAPVGPPPPPPPASCGATTVGSGSCSYNIPGTTSGSNSTGANTAAGFTGSATLHCASGIWSAVGSTCTATAPPSPPPACLAKIHTSGACSYPLPTTASGASIFASNTTPAYTGGVNASCVAGAWSIGAATCGPLPPPPPTSCAPTSTSWSTWYPPTFGDGATPGHWSACTALVPSISVGASTVVWASATPRPGGMCSWASQSGTRVATCGPGGVWIFAPGGPTGGACSTVMMDLCGGPGGG